MFRPVICFTTILCLSSAAETYTVDRDESLFAVVTQRDGIAARMAHDHLIAAEGYDAAIQAVDGAITEFSFRCESKRLLVDNPKAGEKWADRLIEAGLLQASFKVLSRSDRKSIQKHMLDEDQLDAEDFPSISASVVSVTEGENEFRGSLYTHTAELELTVRDETVTRKVSANVIVREDTISIEAAAAYRFTEFGIEPYSAMFGAVKNQDEFFVFCSIVAEREP